MPGAERLEPGRRRRCGSRARPRRAACARCATFWWAWKIVSLSPGCGGRREAHGHALREERAVVRARQEVAPAAADDAEPVGHRREHVLQRAAARPPELVRIRVDHPVGAVLGRREPRHPRDPRVLAHVVGRLADEPQDAGALVPLEDLRRPVARRVVDRDRRSRRRHGGGTRPARRRRPPRRARGASSRASSHGLPEDLERRVDDALRRPAVDRADDLLDGPAPRRGELRRLRERALDPGHDLLEALGAVETRRTPRAPGSACRRRSSPPTTPPAARPRRRGRRRPAGRRRARRAGSSPRCRRRHPRVGAASRAPRGPSSSPPGRTPCPRTRLRPRSAPASRVSRGWGRKRSCRRSREVLIPPLDETLDEPPLVGRVARRVARRRATTGRPGSSP